MMEVAARLKYARLSAQKCRLICDLVRGLPVDRALDVLRFSTKKRQQLLKKYLNQR